MSSYKTLAKVAGITKNWVQVSAAPLAWETMNVKDYLFRDGSNSPLSAQALNGAAWYGIAKGIMQIAEGIGICGAENKNTGSAQIISGLAAVITGLVYEFIGTSALPLGLVLGGNVLVDAVVAWKRAKDYRAFKLGNIINSAQGRGALVKPDAPVSLIEHYLLPFKLLEAIGFCIIPSNAQYLTGTCLFFSGVISVFPAFDKTVNNIKFLK